MNLKNKIISFLNAKDCTGLTVDGGMGEYILIFTRENKYVRTTDEFVLLTEAENSQRVFHDCYSSHNHDKLLNDSRFNAMIKKSGMEFIECAGGYVTDYSRVKDDFTLKDEIRVKVYFKVGSKEMMYILDLDRMELSDDYFELWCKNLLDFIKVLIVILSYFFASTWITRYEITKKAKKKNFIKNKKSSWEINLNFW